MMTIFETINPWAEIWLSYMGNRMLDAAFVFAVVGFLWILVRKRVSVQFGYVLFLLVLIKSVLPAPIYLPSLPLGFIPKPTVVQKSEGTVVFWGFENKRQENREAVPTQEKREESAPSAGSQATHSQNLSFSGTAMLSWAILTGFFLIRLGWMSWKTRFLISKTIPLNPGSIPLDLETLKQDAGVKRRIRWVTGDWVKSPMAYGTLHPKIAVPRDMKENFTSNQIRWILLHELAHIRRGDVWISTIQKILLAFFFFNPLMWWVNSIVDQLREYACDDAALAGSHSSSKECGEGFLGVVLLMNNLPTFTLATLGLFDYETMIRRRLLRIIDKRTNRKRQLSFWAGFWLTVIALLVIPVGVKFAFAHIAQWNQLPTDDGDKPPTICGECMAYDSQRGVSILAGGANWESINLATWELDNRLWKKTSDKGPGRYCAGMAYDPNRNATIYYGGYNGINGTFDRNTYTALTWEMNGDVWNETDLEDRELRACAPLVYFPELHCVIRHGGMDGFPTDPFTTYYNDTLKFDGSRWIKIAEGPVRAVHKMIYDSVRKKIVLFGGMDAPNSYPEDTWEFDGIVWTQVAVSGPPGRHWFGFAFDESRGVAVLFGGNRRSGFGSNDRWFGDTWERDGLTWTEINTPSPGTAYSPEMVYDSNRQAIVMFLPSGRGTGHSAERRDTPNLEIIRETWEYGAILRGIAFNRLSPY